MSYISTNIVRDNGVLRPIAGYPCLSETMLEDDKNGYIVCVGQYQWRWWVFQNNDGQFLTKAMCYFDYPKFVGVTHRITEESIVVETTHEYQAIFDNNDNLQYGLTTDNRIMVLDCEGNETDYGEGHLPIVLCVYYLCVSRDIGPLVRVSRNEAVIMEIELDVVKAFITHKFLFMMTPNHQMVIYAIHISTETDSPVESIEYHSTYNFTCGLVEGHGTNLLFEDGTIWEISHEPSVIRANGVLRQIDQVSQIEPINRSQKKYAKPALFLHILVKMC